MNHPEHADFEAFVIGALSAAERDVFVAHVSTCEACASTLQDEAKAELAIIEIHDAAKVADTARKPPVRRRRPTALWAGASALALAAAVFLIVLTRRDRQTESTPSMTISVTNLAKPIPFVDCPDGLGQEKCVEDAHSHGLFVRYPAWAGAPPLGGSSGPGPNGSPFPTQM